MSLVILKHFLVDEPLQEIKVPTVSRTLSVQLQGNCLCLWREGDASAPSKTVTIEVMKTGRPFERQARRTFLATIVFADAVWHIYERD